MHTITPPDDWLDLILLWLDYLRSNGTAASSIKLRSYQLRRFACAHADPLAVTFDDLVAWLATDDWSASTKHSTRSALRSFYEWLQFTDRRPDDPSKRLRPVKVPIGRCRPAGELTVRSIQRHADDRTRLMGKLASIESMRAVEIAQVHTDDVVRDLVGYSLIVHGKGSKVRVIPLDDEIARELLDRPPGFVFPGRIDGHLSGPYVTKLLSRALPDGTTGHMLRHRGAAKFYVGTGYDLRATQEFLGHASPATTQVYTPAEPDQMRRGLEATAAKIGA